MSSINTNVSSMLARRVLGQQQSMMTQTLERLSTGVSINRGSDNPAGLIASESLRAEKAAINAAIGNAERAEQMVNIAEGGLQEINNLLVELQSLVGQSANEAGLSSDERAANQQQIDSILSTIDSIASSTEFNGQKLLNGGFDYTFDNNFDDQTWTYASVNSAKFSGSSAIDVNISVQTAAEKAVLYFETGATFDADGDGDTTGTESRTVEISTSQGVQQFTFNEGTSQDDIIAALNSYGEQLGFSAEQDGTDANFIAITSTNYGSAESVRGREIQSNFGSFTNDVVVASVSDTTVNGVDLGALINGVQAVTNGLNARVSTGNLDLELTLDGTSSTNEVGEQDTFQITGGGANFNFSPSVDDAGKTAIGIKTVGTQFLGNGVSGYLGDLKSGGSASVDGGSATSAQEIIDLAIKQVSAQRGRLGAFSKNTVGSTIKNLGVSLENTAAAESAIRDTDYAFETAELTRLQIMNQAATQALALANNAPTAVLSLLG